LQYIYRTLQFIVFSTLSNLNKTSKRAVTHTSYKMHENRCVLRVICTCDQWFTALCTPTDSSDKTQLIVVQPS